jgi:transposase-like protein
MAQARIDAFAARWRDSYPAAVRCLLDDRESLTVYLRFPRQHWTRVRHSNFIWVNRPRRGRLAEAA